MALSLDVLHVVVILLLARECQLGALVQLVCIALPRDIHHHEVLLIIGHAVHRVELDRRVAVDSCARLRLLTDALTADGQARHVASSLSTLMQARISHLLLDLSTVLNACCYSTESGALRIRLRVDVRRHRELLLAPILVRVHWSSQVGSVHRILGHLRVVDLTARSRHRVGTVRRLHLSAGLLSRSMLLTLDR